MPAILHLRARDDLSGRDAGPFEASTGTLLFVFFTLLFLATALSISLLHLRRRRLDREQGLLPPPSNHIAHRRSAAMSRISTFGRNDAIFLYSSNPPSSPVPEIRVTFPDDDDQKGSQKQGRVVVVHVTDTGSVGMSPLDEDQLPPYQRSDADGFQSLDLNRMGGLREKEPFSSQPFSSQR